MTKFGCKHLTISGIQQTAADMTTFQLPLALRSASLQMASTSLTQTENSSMDRLLSRYSSFFSHEGSQLAHLLQILSFI